MFANLLYKHTTRQTLQWQCFVHNIRLIVTNDTQDWQINQPTNRTSNITPMDKTNKHASSWPNSRQTIKKFHSFYFFVVVPFSLHFLGENPPPDPLLCSAISGIIINNNSNNKNNLHSPQREIKAVVRSHNEEHISIILSHETHAHTHS